MMAPDTTIVTGQVLQQISLDQALITPLGRTQTTLAAALANAGSGGATVASVADLQNLAPTGANQLVYLLGYALPNDGGQGFFIWEAGSGAAPDGGTIFTTTGNTGPAGPNLFENPATWSVLAGSPTISPDGQSLSDAGTEFWQATTVVSGFSIGTTYTVSWDYTVAASPTNGYSTIAPGGYAHTPASSPTPISYQFTATTTSITFTAAGQASANSIANISISEAAGGRWARMLDEPGLCFPEWWGAKGDGLTDDTPAINSAIAWASQFNNVPGGTFLGYRGKMELAPGKIYVCNEAWSTINPCAISVDGCGATVNFGACVASPCIYVAGSGSNQPWGNDAFRFSDMVIFGNTGVTNQVGIAVGGGGDLTAHIRFDQIVTRGFAIDHQWLSFTYFITLYKCFFVQLQSINTPFDSGEMNVIDTCVGGWIDWQVDGSCFIIHSSFDYNPRFARNRAGSLNYIECHFETNVFTPLADWLAPFEIGPGEAIIRFENPELLWTGGSPAPPLFHCTSPAPFGVKIIDPLWAGGAGFGQNTTTNRLTLVPTVPGLDASKTSIGLTLSNNDLTATSDFTAVINFSHAFGTYANCGTLKGKWYFNLTINAFTPTGATAAIVAGLSQFIGFTEAPETGPGVTLLYDPNNSGNNGLWLTEGAFWTLQTAFTPAITPGSVWWFFVDFDATLLWVSSDNGITWCGSNTSGNPGAGTDGLDFSALLGGMNQTFPQILNPATGLCTINDQVTFNFNPSLSGVAGVSGFNGNPWSQVFTLVAGGSVQVFGSKSANLGISTSYPPLIDIGNSLNADPTFENGTGTTFLDAWSLTQDSAAITSRVTGTNVAISIGTAKPHTGLQALQIVKAGAATTVAAFGVLFPCRVLEVHSGGFWYAASANSLGTFVFNIKYVQLLYYGSGGVPFFGQDSVAAPPVTLIPTTTYQQGLGAVIQPPAPPWATHALFEFDMKAMAAGTLYIDDAEFYRW